MSAVCTPAVLCVICAAAVSLLPALALAASVQSTSRHDTRSRSLLFVRDETEGRSFPARLPALFSTAEAEPNTDSNRVLPAPKPRRLVAKRFGGKKRKNKSLLFHGRSHFPSFSNPQKHADEKRLVCQLFEEELLRLARVPPVHRSDVWIGKTLVRRCWTVRKALGRLRRHLVWGGAHLVWGGARRLSPGWVLAHCRPPVPDRGTAHTAGTLWNKPNPGSTQRPRSRARLVSRRKLEPSLSQKPSQGTEDGKGTRKSGVRAAEVKDTENFRVRYDYSEGQFYSLEVGNSSWVSSAPTSLSLNGSRFSTGDGSLLYLDQDSDTGADVIGDWLSTSWRYSAGNLTQVVLTLRLYTLQPLAVFSQSFVNDTVSLKLTADDVVCGFPSFYARKVKGQKLGFLSLGGSRMGSEGLHMGNWSASEVNITSGRGSGPLVIFNNGSDAIVVAPFNNFMTSSLWLNASNASLHWGPMGSLTSHLGGRETSFLVFYGNQGLTRTVQAWGDLMRSYYGKDGSLAEADQSLLYLGYSTAQGAYFYNHTLRGKTMEQELEDVRKSARILHIPYRHLQLGPWWFPTDRRGGTLTWTPSPQVFPFGLQDLYDHLGWTMAAENGAWSSNTSYAKQHGGQYDFVLDPPLALPLGQEFWDDLFETSREWGLSVYQQDAMDVQFSDVNVSTSDVYMSRDWLRDMGEAARENEIFIQYGDALPRQALASLEIAAVTRAGVSGGFQQDELPAWLQWSHASLLASSLGLAPVPPAFWSNGSQPLNPYGRNDSYPALRAIMASLSTGPVTPGDDIGVADLPLLLRSCNADGLLLKPSMPLLMLDEAVQQAAFQVPGGLRGQLWQATSNVSGYSFGVVMATNMSASFILRASMTLIGASSGVVMTSDFNGEVKLQMFDGSHALTIPASCSSRLPCLYYLAPIMGVVENFVVIYGELGKWVPMSPSRVTRLSREYQEITLDLSGAVNETVTFLFIENFAYNVTISCNLGPSAAARLYYTRRGCVHM